MRVDKRSLQKNYVQLLANSCQLTALWPKQACLPHVFKAPVDVRIFFRSGSARRWEGGEYRLRPRRSGRFRFRLAFAAGGMSGKTYRKCPVSPSRSAGPAKDRPCPRNWPPGSRIEKPCPKPECEIKHHLPQSLPASKFGSAAGATLFSFCG